MYSKTKEEIIKDKLMIYALDSIEAQICDIEELMQEYADQEMIAFAEWLRKDWMPLAPNKNEWIDNSKTRGVQKTYQLIELYKQSLNK